MKLNTLALLVPWIISHGYLLFFLIALLEGSLVSTAAGVAAGLGFFNIYIVIAISLAGDMVADVLYYAIGYYSHNVLKNKFVRFIGLNESRFEHIKTILHDHTHKALLLIKISPLVGPPGLIAVGTVRVPFRKFFKIITVISICKSLFFSLLGFYSAMTYVQLSRFISNNQYVILIIAAFILLVYFGYKKMVSGVTEKIEEVTK